MNILDLLTSTAVFFTLIVIGMIVYRNVEAYVIHKKTRKAYLADCKAGKEHCGW